MTFKQFIREQQMEMLEDEDVVKLIRVGKRSL